ncbi:carbamate kinase [Kineosporia sp. R_H_3]|uniref:carbamate kinase n=1 Tax=Kineosporia sp. R_H_3 TaxID=1961848 RepID=UPI000B4BF959|nr:carbamate kinase [Kineosporia sp. R_H_3]
MRVLVALGGNAMTAPDGSARPADQRAAVEAAVPALVRVVADGHDLVVTHGNGPQVGNLLVKNELAAAVVPPVPLDWCGAQTQGTIGALLLDALDAGLAARGLGRRVAALVTRTVVDGDDPGFTHPTKPIGRYLPAAEAAVLVEHGQVWADRGERGWRRMVASPEPLEVLDAPAAAALLDAGFVVVCAGGGGVPTVRQKGPDGAERLVGVQAVIDKDLTAAMLGRALAADVLVVATDVDHVMVGFGTPAQRPLEHVTAAQLRAHAAAGEFASGSMGPKVEAVCRFVEAGRPHAAITSLDRISQAVAGVAGTVVTAAPHGRDPVRTPETL